jgi:hypothetical protein
MSTRRAVVIGVDKYKDERISPLQGAVNDATEIRDRLRTYGGFEVPDDAFLINDKAGCLAVRNAISDLLWCTNKHDLSLFYFSGHGFQDDYGHGYIAPFDLTYDRPLVCGLRMQELKELLLKAKNKPAVLVVLDCCYSGIVAEGSGDRAIAAAADTVNFDRLFQDLGEAGAGRIVLASSEKDEKSREVQACVHGIGGEAAHCHGAFTFQILEALDGQAADANGVVTLGALQDFVDKRMDKDHRPTSYGSGVHGARDIVIAQASQLHQIRTDLYALESRLANREDPLDFFMAINDLAEILQKAPNLEAAKQLKSKADDMINNDREQCIDFLQKNIKIILKQVTSIGFNRVHQLALDLSFDSIKEGDSTWATLGELYRAAQKKIAVDAYLKRLGTPSQIASPLPAASRPQQQTRNLPGIPTS